MLLAVPSAGRATWNEAVTISTAGQQAIGVAVAMNRQNVAAVTWIEHPPHFALYHEDFQVFVGVAQPGAAFKVTHLDTGGKRPKVAVGPRGEVLVVWFDDWDEQLRAAFQPAGGSFGKPVVLATYVTDDIADMFVGFDSSGVATVVWGHGLDPGKVVTRGTDGRWSSTRSLDQAGPLGEPVAALAPNGDLAVATYKDETHIVVARRSGSSGSITYQTFTSSSVRIPRQVVTDDAGNMTLYVTSDNVPWSGAMSDRPAGGTFGAFQALGSTSSGMSWHTVARSAAGDLFVHFPPGYTDEPDILRVRPRGSSALDAGTSVPFIPGPLLAADPGGSAYLLAHGSSPRTDQPSIVAVERAPGGQVTGPTDLSFPDGIFRGPLSAATGAAGHALAAWTRADFTFRVQVTIRVPGPDRPPPPPRPVPVQPTPLDHSANFQADPAHTGNLEGVGLRLPLKREYAIPFQDTSYVNPVVDRGRLFVPNYNPSGVTAFDLGTGTHLWTANIAEPNRRTLAATDGVIYVAGGDGVMAAHDGATGKVLWSKAVATRLTEPVVHDGKVFTEDAFRGGVLYALKTADGSLAWPARGDVVSGPVTVGGGRVMIASSGAYAAAYRAADGAFQWRHDMGYTGSGATTAYDGQYLWAYEGGGGRIYDTTTGAAVKGLTGDEIPALRAPYAYQLRSGGLEAIDEQTFAVRWRFAPADKLQTMPLIVDGIVYVVSESGMLYGLDPVTGNVRWSEDVGNTQPLGRYGLLTLAAGYGRLVVNTGEELVVYSGAPEPAPGSPPPSQPPATAPPPSGGGSSSSASGGSTPAPEGQSAQASADDEPAPEATSNQAESSNRPPSDDRFTGARLIGRRAVLIGSKLVIRLQCPADAATLCSTVLQARTMQGRAVATRRLIIQRGKSRTIRLGVGRRVPHRLAVAIRTSDIRDRRTERRWIVTVERSSVIALKR